MKRVVLITAAVIAVLLMAGCQRIDGSAGRAASDLPPGPLQPLPSETAPAAPNCRVLAVSRGETRSESDADFLEIVLTNDGNADCTAHGYPTLTMLDGSGRSMGERAGPRSNGGARYVVVRPGESVKVTVRYPKVSECKGGASRIEVLVPGATERAFISEAHSFCPGWTVTSMERVLS
jgi:hypothetical protein